MYLSEIHESNRLGIFKMLGFLCVLSCLTETTYKPYVSLEHCIILSLKKKKVYIQYAKYQTWSYKLLLNVLII